MTLVDIPRTFYYLLVFRGCSYPRVALTLPASIVLPSSPVRVSVVDGSAFPPFFPIASIARRVQYLNWGCLKHSFFKNLKNRTGHKVEFNLRLFSTI